MGTTLLNSEKYLMPEEGSAQHPQALLRESVSLSTIDMTVRDSTGRRQKVFPLWTAKGSNRSCIEEHQSERVDGRGEEIMMRLP